MGDFLSCEGAWMVSLKSGAESRQTTTVGTGYDPIILTLA